MKKDINKKVKEVPKLNSQEVNESIESLKNSIKSIKQDILDHSKAIEKIDKMLIRLGNLENKLNAYVNRFFAEIRVLPEGHNPDLHGGDHKIKAKNGWEDYSGSFYFSQEEQEQIVIDRAIEHFNTYFEDAIYHRNKKLGIFVSGGGISGKKLIEVRETGE